MNNQQPKTYLYENTATNQKLEFKAKPTNLELRRNSLFLINNFIDFAEPYVGRLVDRMEAFAGATEPDPNEFKGKTKSAEYKEAVKRYVMSKSGYDKALSDYNKKLAVAMSAFLLDEKNLRDMFEQFLEGDVDAIDFSGETDEALLPLVNLGVEVLTDFFDKGRNLMSVFRR